MSILSNASVSRKRLEGFSITRLGDIQFGTNYVDVDLSEKNVQVGFFETASEDFSGAGVFEDQILADDYRLASDLHKRLCEAAIRGPKNDVPQIEPATLYSVHCREDGKSEHYQGKTYQLPRDLFLQLDDFYLKARNRYAQSGRAIVKLDAKVSSVERFKNKILIAVTFVNGGRYAIKMRRPDQWNANRLDQLDVGGPQTGGNGEWDVSLAGVPLFNSSEFTDEQTTIDDKGVTYITIPARESVTFKFLVVPKGKIVKGGYDFYVLARFSANAVGFSSMGLVHFHSDYKNPAKIYIDRDYPSTPEEWKDYESRKSKEISFVRPGASVAEAGFYRAVSVFGPRAPFLTALQAGKPSPMLDPHQWDKWEWEADLARPVKCAPGDACPRDGRWTPRAANHRDRAQGDLIYSAHERRFRVGEQFPAVDVGNDAARSLYWEWLGA